MKKSVKILLTITGIALLSTVVGIILFWLQNNPSENNPNEKSNLDPREVNDVVTGSNEFGFELLQNLYAEDPSKPVFISPLSIEIALALVANGASGETYDEIVETLGLSGLDLSDINEQLNLLQTNLESREILAIANGIWLSDVYTLNTEFKEISTNIFNSELATFNPSNTSADADLINSWVAEATNDKITEVITAGDLAMLQMFLVNAVYFNQDWKYQFNPELTVEEDFYSDDIVMNPLIDIDFADVSMMVLSDGKFNYYEDENLQFVELPYKEEDISMYVFLPNQLLDGMYDGKHVGDILPLLSSEYISEIEEAAEPTEIAIRFPSFEQELSYNLISILEDMGITSAFAPSTSQLDGLIEGTNTYIDLIKHDTYIKVDEEGTEAAAVTSVGIKVTSALPDPAIFNANHTFVYAIVDKNTDTIMFMGIFQPE